ncbi:hypothetical protein IEE94_13825 [Yimella sp. cx-573]|nr:hypothetical protein [Yimella sp. cx-573]
MNCPRGVVANHAFAICTFFMASFTGSIPMIWVALDARSDEVELAVDELALEELDDLIVLEVVLVEALLVGAEVVTDVDDEAVLEVVGVLVPGAAPDSPELHPAKTTALATTTTDNLAFMFPPM